MFYLNIENTNEYPAPTPELQALKAKFLDIYKQNIIRPGSEELLKWLCSADFFVAPASTRFHLAQPGGLVEHSIHVYERLRSLYLMEKARNAGEGASLTQEEEESVAICGLLHDICKVNFYDVEMRNRKNEHNQWEKYPFYVVKDSLPYGHGEKSVYIASGFMRLKREEAMAIRWHMGGFDDAVMGGCRAATEAFSQFPLALLTHLADMQASYLDEVER